MFPIQGLGVYLDQLVNSLCPGLPILHKDYQLTEVTTTHQVGTTKLLRVLLQ
jgi:hypothetical protein